MSIHALPDVYGGSISSSLNSPDFDRLQICRRHSISLQSYALHLLDFGVSEGSCVAYLEVLDGKVVRLGEYSTVRDDDVGDMFHKQQRKHGFFLNENRVVVSGNCQKLRFAIGLEYW